MSAVSLTYADTSSPLRLSAGIRCQVSYLTSLDGRRAHLLSRRSAALSARIVDAQQTADAAHQAHGGVVIYPSDSGKRAVNTIKHSSLTYLVCRRRRPRRSHCQRHIHHIRVIMSRHTTRRCALRRVLRRTRPQHAQCTHVGSSDPRCVNYIGCAHDTRPCTSAVHPCVCAVRCRTVIAQLNGGVGLPSVGIMSVTAAFALVPARYARWNRQITNF